ncbi:MAG: PEP-CTERM sorting domain-containing protein [Candidatus Hydrogenedentes bacterium]|nr:PEP-CTERM sorting domain-containing protein [Candidatus Hydrogenedentota bacterium]
MRNGARVFTVLALTLFAGASASALLVELGTGTGGLGVYFHDSELSENVIYAEADLEVGSDRGMYFEFSHDTLPGIGVSFNDIFSGQPSGQSQFGLDGIAWFQDPTAAVPSMSFADYNWTTGLVDWTPAGPDAPGEGAWAINDYYSGGVTNPASAVRNSLFRGTDLDLENMILTPSVNPEGGTIWTLEISGWLSTDGDIHWFYPTPETTALADLGLSNRFYFEGVFSYVSLLDESELYDYYGGAVTLYAEVVPEPASMTLFGLGLAGLAVVRRRRR